MTMSESRTTAGPPRQAGRRARERRETDEALAERLVRAGLREAGWDEAELRRRPKGDAIKVALAQTLRTQTPVTRQWIATRLHMGSASYLSALLGTVIASFDPDSRPIGLVFRR